MHTRIKTREGHHLFFYPFEGRLVHEGLASLIALRLSRLAPATFTCSVNDYGFELPGNKPPPLEDALQKGLFNWERTVRSGPPPWASLQVPPKRPCIV